MLPGREFRFQVPTEGAFVLILGWFLGSFSLKSQLVLHTFETRSLCFQWLTGFDRHKITSFGSFASPSPAGTVNCGSFPAPALTSAARHS